MRKISKIHMQSKALPRAKASEQSQNKIFNCSHIQTAACMVSHIRRIRAGKMNLSEILSC